jgi:hypothetical protein
MLKDVSICSQTGKQRSRSDQAASLTKDIDNKEDQKCIYIYSVLWSQLHYKFTSHLSDFAGEIDDAILVVLAS